MAEIDQAADAVQSFAEQFRSVITLAEASKKLGSMENAIREREAALETATKVQEEAAQKLKLEQDKLSRLKAEQMDEVNKHHAVLQAATAANQKGAHALVEKARSDATRIIKEAREEAARITEAQTKSAEELMTRMAATQAEYAELRVDLEKDRKEVADLKRKLADIRASAKQLAS